jgi:hypothetical protein
MHEIVGQGLPDVRSEEMAALVSQDRTPDVRTALDKILSGDFSNYQFSNYI